VVYIAPEDAWAYCDWLAGQEHFAPAYAGESLAAPDRAGYRLLTESEWEFACRAGTTGFAFCDWNNDDELRKFVWFKQDGETIKHPVGMKLPNPFGLFDMLGSVSEMCQDRFQYDSYPPSTQINPVGPADSNFGVVTRGGGADSLKEKCRSASRSYAPTKIARRVTFRLALPVDSVRQALKVTGPAIPRSPE
jgi:formylglycine-generating enzyme required for sulfatase activity